MVDIPQFGPVPDDGKMWEGGPVSEHTPGEDPPGPPAAQPWDAGVQYVVVHPTSVTHGMTVVIDDDVAVNLPDGRSRRMPRSWLKPAA